MPIILSVGRWTAGILTGFGAWEVLDWFKDDSEVSIGPKPVDSIEYAKLGAVSIVAMFAIFSWSKKTSYRRRY